MSPRLMISQACWSLGQTHQSNFHQRENPNHGKGAQIPHSQNKEGRGPDHSKVKNWKDGYGQVTHDYGQEKILNDPCVSVWSSGTR